MALNTLRSRIQYRVNRSKNNVFVPKDFLDLSDRDQVGRALKQLISKKLLIKIGQGLYAKAKTSSLTNNSIPILPIQELAREAITNKLNARVVPSKAERSYNLGESTQVPSGRVIAVTGRINRKIFFDKTSIILKKENNKHVIKREKKVPRNAT